ncbi:MAG: ABC transporter permease [Planctomycetes bacterium]|nr:ABC transporter permease [Planctomycetota bacterium]NUQ33383.1 ABC transporter permease [Planctomycetaceae bacterium]
MLHREAYHKLRKDKIVVVCFAVIVVCAVLAVIAPLVGNPSQDYRGIDEVTKIERPYHPPTLLIALSGTANGEPLTDEQKKAFGEGLLSAAAWRLPLGADLDGRNVLVMVIHGLQKAFLIGVITTVLAILIAVPIGAAAGYFGGLIDDAIVWFYTTLASVPHLLLLIAVLQSVPGEWKAKLGLFIVLIVIGVTTWVGLARLIRAEFLKHKQRDYVLAARALGVGHGRIIFAHILPNVSHLVIITFTLGFVSSVNLEVFLSFVSIGIPPSEPTWGQMIAKGKDELSRDPSIWWPLTSATVFLFVLSLAFSIFGDALRDALDPKLRT